MICVRRNISRLVKDTLYNSLIFTYNNSLHDNYDDVFMIVIK